MSDASSGFSGPCMITVASDDDHTGITTFLLMTISTIFLLRYTLIS